MTVDYGKIKQIFGELIDKYHLGTSPIQITTRALSPQEAIGDPSRQDYPLLNGKEVLINAEFAGCHGQAFTDQPDAFSGSLTDVLALPLDTSHNLAIFIASLNAVMNHLGQITEVIHCKNDFPEQCGKKCLEFIRQNHPGAKIGFVGFQPAIIDHLRHDFKLRILDLDVNNIGKVKYNTLVEDGLLALDDVLAWCDIVIATGSTVANATINSLLKAQKPTYFYGTTIAGVAKLCNLERLCFTPEE